MWKNYPKSIQAVSSLTCVRDGAGSAPLSVQMLKLDQVQGNGHSPSGQRERGASTFWGGSAPQKSSSNAAEGFPDQLLGSQE